MPHGDTFREDRPDGDTKDSVMKGRTSRKSIGFQTIKCLRCKGTRTLGQPCPECGAKARYGEVNALVVKRLAVVRRIEEGLEVEDLVEIKDVGLPSDDDVSESVYAFIKALGDLIEKPDSQETIMQMKQALRVIHALTTRCETLPELRPAIGKHRSLRRCMSVLMQLWPTYAQVLTASDPTEAKKLSDEGQRLIDSVSAEVDGFQNLMESVRALEDTSTPDFLDRSLQALAISHPDLSLLDLAEVGAREAAEAIEVPVDTAHGPQFLILNSIASAHLDADRFASVLQRTARFCIVSPHLKSVAAEPQALESLAASARLLWESLASFEATLLREADEQALIRRILKFYGEFYEDVAGPLFAWYNLLAGIKSQSYEKLIQSDVTVLARNLTANELTHSFLTDSGADFRNAAQHGSSLSHDNGHLIFKLRSFSARLTYAEVIDRVFLLFESTAAMSWSLTNALASYDFTLPIGRTDSAYMDLSEFRLATLWIEGRGGRVLETYQTAASWHFTIDGQSGQELTLAHTLLRGAPESIVEVTVRSPIEAPHVSVPFSELDRLSPTQQRDDDVGTLSTLVNLRHASRIGHKPVLITSDLKFATASVGMFVLLKDDMSFVPNLRRILGIATEVDATEVATVVRRIFGQIRKKEAGIQRELASTLNKWLEGCEAPVIPQSHHVTVFR